MLGLVYIGYFVLGPACSARCSRLIFICTGLHMGLLVPLAVFIAYTPLVGTVVGLIVAVNIWQWTWLLASAVFLTPFFLIVLLVMRLDTVEGNPGDSIPIPRSR